MRPSVPTFTTAAYAHVAGRVTVHVSGIPSVRGQLYVELYDEATYFHYERVLAETIVPVDDKTMTVTLEHVPAGRYIVCASHDANANAKLDRGFLGIPTEAYGFSRDARGTFGPPSFEAGAFAFDGTELAISVPVR
jgi:uncharacterized protein (DUF2141 family)